MEDLIALGIEKGGIILLLVIVAVVLWIQLTRNSVPRKMHEQLEKRIDDLDDDIIKGILPAIEKLYESERHTQQTLEEIRRNQELQARLIQSRLSGGIETKDILRLLDHLSEGRTENPRTSRREGKR